MDPIVEVHAHAWVPDAELLVRRADHHAAAPRGSMLSAGDGRRPLTRRRLRALVDLDTRLAVMDDVGVDVAAVSVVPGQYHNEAGRTLAAELVDVVNSALAGLARRAPDRLVGVGTVALQHPDLAADQLRHAVDDYDFRGVQIAPSAGGRALSDPAFDPFWSIAESLGVPVLVHPSACGLNDPWVATRPTDARTPTEVTAALSHLVSGGVLHRFPGLAICLAGGDGYVRADRGSPSAGPSRAHCCA